MRGNPDLHLHFYSEDEERFQVLSRDSIFSSSNAERASGLAWYEGI